MFTIDHKTYKGINNINKKTFMFTINVIEIIQYCFLTSRRKDLTPKIWNKMTTKCNYFTSRRQLLSRHLFLKRQFAGFTG